MSLLGSDKAKLEALIHLLGVVMIIGKYLPLIVGGFAVANITLAILSFVVWNNMILGVVNGIFALGGFIFLGQLLGRRRVHRYQYHYRGQHLKREKKRSPEIKNYSTEA